MQSVAQGAITAGVLVAGGLWLRSIDDQPQAPTPRPPSGRTARIQPGGYRASSDDQRLYTIYIAGSEDEAAMLRAGGLDLALDAVVVATNSDDAARLIDAINEGNRILSALGKEVRVIDVRLN